MKEVSKALAAVAESFISALNCASYQTETGKNLIQKYQSYTMANSVDSGLVNNFIREAKSCTYDSGVNTVLEAVTSTIANYKYSWVLESACESIEKNGSGMNYLNRNAAKKVRPLLEMEEKDVVSYIKAGALKEVMFCESFRNIAKAIYKDCPVVESNSDWKMEHPVSVVESKDGKIYFSVANKLYKMTEDTVEEALESEVSNDFRQVNNLLHSGLISYANETLEMALPNFKLTVNEEGKCTKTYKEKVFEYNVEQLREQNALYVRNIAPQKRNYIAGALETFAKIVENFNSIVIVDNASVFTTNNDQFLVIETANGKAYGKSLHSKTNQPWAINDSIFETVKFIRKKTNTDLSEYYADAINEEIAKAEEKDAEAIKESLKENEIQKRRDKIEALTEAFKNDPVKLAVLSKVAQDLNSIEE